MPPIRKLASALLITSALALSSTAAISGGHGKKDIVETAASNEQFSTLAAAVNAAGLVDVLTYHVLPGKVLSVDIAGKELRAKTVQGSMVDIDATKGVMIDGAMVTTADIETSNGVIHVIDTVILPN